MSAAKYPTGWDEERVRRVLRHYEAQSDEEAVAEDEASYEATTHTVMDVPVELVKAEYSPGQIEVNLAYAPAIEAADRHILMKTACKELALRKGLGLFANVRPVKVTPLP